MPDNSLETLSKEELDWKRIFNSINKLFPDKVTNIQITQELSNGRLERTLYFTRILEPHAISANPQHSDFAPQCLLKFCKRREMRTVPTRGEPVIKYEIFVCNAANLADELEKYIWEKYSEEFDGEMSNLLSRDEV